MQSAVGLLTHLLARAPKELQELLKGRHVKDRAWATATPEPVGHCLDMLDGRVPAITPYQQE